MTGKGFLLLSLLLPGLAAPSLAATPDEPETAFWTDWPTVAVPGDPPVVQTVATEILWRLDCGPDSEVVVGNWVYAEPGPGDTTILLDRQQKHVLIVSSEGEIIREFGREGDGPGDLPGFFRAFALSDGRIGVSNGAPYPGLNMLRGGKIVVLGEAGSAPAVWHATDDSGTGSICTIRDIRCAGDHVLVTDSESIFRTPAMLHRQEILTLDSRNGARTVVARRKVSDDARNLNFDEADYFEPFALGRCDISRTGRIAFAPERDRWLIVVRDPGGAGFVIDRPWNPVKRTKAEVDAAWKALGGTDTCTALDHHPAVGRIRWRPDGNLWVEPAGIEPAEGCVACFDEFSPSGDYLRRVQISVPYTQEGDRIQFLENGRLVLKRGFNIPETSDPPEETAILLLATENETQIRR